VTLLVPATLLGLWAALYLTGGEDGVAERGEVEPGDADQSRVSTASALETS
jgi:hypothetical protein